MDVTAAAIDKILEISETSLVEIDGRQYSDTPLSRIDPPQYYQHNLHSLAGLADLFLKLNEGADVRAKLMVVARRQDYDNVNNSPTLISATLVVTDSFPFNRFLSAEEFCISLLTRFDASDDLHALYRLAAGLTASAVTTSEDDGISQKTTIQKGMATRAAETIRPVWTLKPFRTFMEVEQPSSPFLFRLKADKDQIPHCGLFEADGGRWKIEARTKIQAYLRGRLGETPLIVA